MTVSRAYLLGSLTGLLIACVVAFILFERHRAADEDDLRIQRVWQATLPAGTNASAVRNELGAPDFDERPDHYSTPMESCSRANAAHRWVYRSRRPRMYVVVYFGSDDRVVCVQKSLEVS